MMIYIDKLFQVPELTVDPMIYAGDKQIGYNLSCDQSELFHLLEINHSRSFSVMIHHENRRPTGKLNYTCWYFKMITLKEAAIKGIFMLGNMQVSILPFKNIRICTVYLSSARCKLIAKL